MKYGRGADRDHSPQNHVTVRVQRSASWRSRFSRVSTSNLSASTSLAQARFSHQMAASSTTLFPSQWLLDGLRILLADISTDTELTLDVAEGYKVRIELLYRELLAIEIEHGSLSTQEVSALLNLSKAYDQLSGIIDRWTALSLSDCLAGPVLLCGHTGRHSFRIPFDQLQCLIDFRFSVPQIARLLGISVRTIRRRMSEAGLSIRAQFTDDQLDEIVYSIRHRFPNCGNRMATYCLKVFEFSIIGYGNHNIELIPKEVF